MSSAELSKRVKLYFTGKGLTNAKILGTSCPFLVLETRSSSSRLGDGYEIGRTEPIPSCLDPQWKDGITVTFDYEKRGSNYKIVVRDYVPGHYGDSEVMGSSVEFALSEVVCAPGATKTFDLDGGGTIRVSSEDVGDIAGDLMRVAFFGRNLRSMGTFGTSPYLLVLRVNPNGTRTEIWRTETKDNLSPHWRVTANRPIEEMCSGNLEAEILEVQCWGARSLRGDVSLGYFKCSVMDLWRAGQAGKGVGTGPGFRLLKDKNANLEDAYGDIYVGDIKWIGFPDFRKTLASGEKKLNFITSICISNRSRVSTPEVTKEAIQTICTPLMECVPNKESLVFGYGACIGGKASDYFPLTEATDGKVSGGVDGILNAYTQFLSNCEHSDGTSKCVPTIKKVAALARDAAKNDSVYTVLVIFVHLSDLQYEYNLKAELEKTRGAPLHVIIVSLGWLVLSNNFEPRFSHIGQYIPIGNKEGLKYHLGAVVHKLKHEYEEYFNTRYLSFDPSAVPTTLV